MKKVPVYDAGKKVGGATNESRLPQECVEFQPKTPTL
jgi:hypothetical protein